MKYIYQFAIILLVSALGELLKYFIPFPIPACIYGLVLMLIALMTRIIKLEKIEATADFLLDIMTIVFIPGGVGLITAWEPIKAMLVPAMVIIIVTSVLMIGVTGSVTQFMIHLKSKKEGKGNE